MRDVCRLRRAPVSLHRQHTVAHHCPPAPPFGHSCLLGQRIRPRWCRFGLTCWRALALTAVLCLSRLTCLCMRLAQIPWRVARRELYYRLKRRLYEASIGRRLGQMVPNVTPVQVRVRTPRLFVVVLHTTRYSSNKVHSDTHRHVHTHTQTVTYSHTYTHAQTLVCLFYCCTAHAAPAWATAERVSYNLREPHVYPLLSCCVIRRVNLCCTMFPRRGLASPPSTCGAGSSKTSVATPARGATTSTCWRGCRSPASTSTTACNASAPTSSAVRSGPRPAVPAHYVPVFSSCSALFHAGLRCSTRVMQCTTIPLEVVCLLHSTPDIGLGYSSTLLLPYPYVAAIVMK